MFPAVASQLVRSGEPLPASLVIADIRLLSGVLPDVHLKVRQLQVPLCAARVEAHEGFPLLLGLYGLVLLLRWDAGSLVARLLVMRDDEGRVAGHHVQGRGTLVHVSISWNARGNHLEG